MPSSGTTILRIFTVRTQYDGNKGTIMMRGNLNMLVILRLMASDIHRMLSEKNDRAVHCFWAHDLDDPDLQRLRTALMKVERLCAMIKSEGHSKLFDVTVAEVCDCEVHIRHLRQAGLVFLSDLHKADPLLRQDVLHEAEMEAKGVRQHHLYFGLRFKLDELVKSINNKDPFA